MDATQFIRELCIHQEWADTEQWRAFEACTEAMRDPIIRDRCYHVHAIQRAYLQIVRGEPIVIPELDLFPDMVALKPFVKNVHDGFHEWIHSISTAQLDKKAIIPWFHDPPIDITIGEAVIQVVMHSQYHRGQNAVRLRELGGEPPLTDLVVWAWKGKPVAVW